MPAALIITLRETLEASLVAGILLSYLKKTKNEQHNKYVWGGVGAGIVCSVLLMFVFNAVFGGFEGKAEAIYEGVLMLFASGLLTWMIVWMMQQRHEIKKNIEGKASAHIKEDHPWGLFMLTFVAVLREGIETVIFLQAAWVASEGNGMLWSALAGIVIAILLSWALFKGFAKVSLRKFFTATSVLLILFAAGLFAHGIHEFQEAGVVPIIAEHVWDVNPAVVEEGVYPLMHEKGAIGGILKGLFGYNGNPNLLEVVAYFVYLAGISLYWRKVDAS